ncbi:MAG: lysoplasmalogenase [Erysipelotrichaceae bacterium]|nr:lysoplasmalogenase [Erysipelotrichaceae bacterium]MDY5252170.1 lysoplasmalogenase family protein [Erysipelotrichaceae bacterium]
MIISIFYWLSFLALIYVTSSRTLQKYRIFCKALTSSLFIAVYLILNKQLDMVMLGALIACFIGDILLGYKKNGHTQYLVYGASAFLIAHLLYIYVMSQFASLQLSDTLLSIFALIILKLITYKLDIHFGSKRYIIWLYTFIVVMMGNKAFDIALTQPSLFGHMLGAGGILFVLSDFILLFLYFKFKNNLQLQLTNSFIYYLAQYLLALAFYFIA